MKLTKQMKVEQNKQKYHITVLDGFRGLAILLVMWFHIWQQSWLSNKINILGLTINFDFFAIGGFIGVELFFL